MRYEWKKLPLSAVLLMIGVLLLNAWLFNSHCNDTYDGFALAQIREAFSLSAEELAEKDTEEGNRYFEFDDNSVNGMTLRSLSGAVLARRDLNYAEHLKGIRADADFRINSGLFGDENSFSVRSMVRIKEIYQKLEGLQVTPTFSGSIEVFDGWRLSDLFFLFFGCVSALFLLTQERRSGLVALLRPMKRGHGALYLQKFAAMSLTALLGFVLIYGTDFAIAVGKFGIGDLSRPIQSVYGFENCPIPLTVLGYLLSVLFVKLLWGWAVCTLFFAVCAVNIGLSGALLSAVGIAAVALSMGNSANMWLRTFSLSYLAGTEKLYRQCTLLDFFGTPVRQYPVAIAFCAVVLVLCFLIAWFAFVRGSAVPVSRNVTLFSLRPLSRHTNLFFREGQKLLRLHGGLLLLILFVAVQCLTYREYDRPNSQWDFYYRAYSEQLSGEPSAASDQFIADEQARFAEIYEKINDYYAAHPDETESSMVIVALQNELAAEQPFLEAVAQYESLRDGQSYVYRSGYERLYAVSGRKENLLNLMKWLLFLILVFSGVFAVERETSMDVIQTSVGAKQRVARYKVISCGILLLISFWVVYLPQFLAVRANYGLPEMSAMANSLAVFRAFPDGWTIRGAMVAVGLIRLLIGVDSGALILFFSRKLGNKTTAMLFGVGCLLLPAAILLMLL